MSSFDNQTLAALANIETGVIKAQLRHSQSGEGTLERKDRAGCISSSS